MNDIGGQIIDISEINGHLSNITREVNFMLDMISLMWPLSNGRISDIPKRYLVTDITYSATDNTYMATDVAYMATINWPDK